MNVTSNACGAARVRAGCDCLGPGKALALPSEVLDSVCLAVWSPSESKLPVVSVTSHPAENHTHWLESQWLMGLQSGCERSCAFLEGSRDQLPVFSCFGASLAQVPMPCSPLHSVMTATDGPRQSPLVELAVTSVPPLPWSLSPCESHVHGGRDCAGMPLGPSFCQPEQGGHLLPSSVCFGTRRGRTWVGLEDSGADT